MLMNMGCYSFKTCAGKSAFGASLQKHTVRALESCMLLGFVFNTYTHTRQKKKTFTDIVTTTRLPHSTRDNLDEYG